MDIMGMASLYGVRPSVFLGEECDDYTAYCFDEALAYIQGKIREGVEPKFRVHYNSIADMYKSYGV